MSSGLSMLRRSVSGGWVDRDVSFPAWAFVIPMLAVFVAEAALFFGRSDYALWIHLLTLLFCALVPLRNEETIALLQPFALLPLFRLVNLGMPTFFELTLLFFPFTYLPLLPALYLVARSQGIRIGTNARAFAIGVVPVVLISVPLAIGEYAIIAPESLIPEPSVFWLLAIMLVMIGMVGLVEELLFRGILQRRFADYLGRWGGVIVASVLFGAMHSIYGSGLEILYATLLGLLFGAIYEWTDSIGLVSVLHGTLNVFLFAVIPIYRPDIAAEILVAVRQF